MGRGRVRGRSYVERDGEREELWGEGGLDEEE